MKYDKDFFIKGDVKMNIILFLILAIIEYVMILFLTNRLTKLKEYITINYSSFEFSDMGEKPYGLNILIKILFPVIFMIVSSGIIYKLKINELVENIYLIVIFYYLIRWCVSIFLLNRKELINWKEECILFGINVLINALVYYSFITKTTQIFVSVDELRDAIWIGIITFVFVIVRDFIYRYINVDNYKLEKRKEKYILKNYEYLKDKYQDIIKTKSKQLHMITYAIMIYENFNRPYVVRTLEKIKFFIKGNATLGIMQVNTRVLIDDRTSVKRGYNILKKNYFKNKKIFDNKEDLINETISSYNRGQKYLNEVKYIKNIIQKEY